MPMALPHYCTPDLVRQLPDDGNRYETVHGELLVTPAPGGRHQDVLFRLIRVLDHYLAEHGIADLLGAPADLSFDGDALVQPDLFVADLGAFHRSGAWADIRTLYLVIEIVSPSSAQVDRFTKRRLYQEQRIPEYWVVDIDQRQIEVWTPDAHFPVIEREQLTWQHPALDTACTVDLVRLFAVG
jgi:Uma2 family endonuclease